MKKIALLFVALVALGCQESDRTMPIDVEGTWYGDIPSDYPTTQYSKLYVKLNDGVVKVSSSASLTSGWFSGEGTYEKHGDMIIFDVELKVPDIMEGTSIAYPKYKITHADNITRSSIDDSPILKLHFNKTFKGEISSSWMWMEK